MPRNDRPYRAVIRTALGLFRGLDFRITLEGAHHIPSTGGAVVAANHVSYFDFMLVGYAALPHRLVRFMAKKSVFDHKLSGPLMRSMHHIPVDRRAGGSAYAAAVRALHDGELIGVFPEATISQAFTPIPMKSGAARMALDAGVPIVPVVTWGAHRLWTKGRKPRLQRHVPVTIRVGEPLLPAPGEDAAALTARLAETLTRMIDEVQRDYPERPSPGQEWWLPAHLGGTAPTLADLAH
ncbi:MAG TPA: lysophospholipid acyltransferase family protein [Mycobacteriales bacterium]|nr:lysophospholipid acyltransferase family protein [Mycobacteriales bacterium]